MTQGNAWTVGIKDYPLRAKGLSKQYQDKQKQVPYSKMDINTATKLVLITNKAKQEPKFRFTSLMHLLNVNYLKECYKLLKKGKAAGIDKRTLESYTEEEINKVLKETVDKLKKKKYRPQPVRRVYISKPNGDKRPLGIPTVRDKIIQLACTRILECIFEPTLLPISYGYRPNKDAHGCLKEINHMIMQKKVNWIIDADIKEFFDHVSHDWMMKCLDQRIADPRFKRLIFRFLEAGIMEAGKYHKTNKGTPQGGIISPILANIYLHYTLDLWFEYQKTKQQGYTKLIRYADDFIIGVQYKWEAEQILKQLEARLQKFGLELSKEKTKIIEFGRFANQNRKRKGQGKPRTFTFLGLTHYCTTTKDERFMVRVRTNKKKMSRALKDMNSWLKAIRNRIKIQEIWPLIASKLRGHYNYYGISGNFESINRFYKKTCCLTCKWMNRRSQKRSWYWNGFYKYLETYPLPRPKLAYEIYNTW